MRSSPPLLISLICGTLLIFLTAAVWAGLTDEVDKAMRQLALSANTPSAVIIWKKISFLASGIVIAPLSVIVVCAFAVLKLRRDAIHFALIMIGGVIIVSGMKLWIHRPRPAEVFADTLPASFSFPSGHALFATAFYVSFALIACRAIGSRKRITAGLVAGALALAVGMSRIFLGVHYPTDVLGGYLAAGLWIAVLELADQKYGGWITKRHPT